MMNRHLFLLMQVVVIALFAASLTVPSTLFAANEIIDEDCNINEALFEQEWRKYSHFGDLIPMESRSWEVKQYYDLQSRIDELNRESFMLQAEMEFDRHIRLELREVKQSLVRNLRANLVKSFIRLSFLTADAINTGVSLGGTYANLFTEGVYRNLPEGLSYLKNAMEVVTGLTPDHGNSELASEVKSRAGDLEDTLKIIENPWEIGYVVAERVKDKAEDWLNMQFPSVSDMEFSEDEVELLRSQHLANRAIDHALLESYLINSIRRSRVMEEIPAEIEKLREEQARWELEEKARVRDLLIYSCKERKKNLEEDVDDEDFFGDDQVTTERDVIPAVDGISGYWAGYSRIVKIFDAAGLDEKERQLTLNTPLPNNLYIERDETGQYMVYSKETNQTFPLVVEGRKLSFYVEFFAPGAGPEGTNLVLYQVMSGEIDEQGKTITGTAEIGDHSLGPFYYLNVYLKKQN